MGGKSGDLADKVLCWVRLGSRMLLGVFLVILGLNGVSGFMDISLGTEVKAFLYGGAIYYTYWIAITNIIAGLTFVLNTYVGLGLFLFLPVLFNFITFHLFTGTGSLILPLVMLLVVLDLLREHKGKFLPIFKM